MTGMTRERFEELADAHGGRIARWPVAERDAATLFAETEPAAQDVLRAASALDDVLDAWPAPAVEAALRDRVIAAAPSMRRRPLAAWIWRVGAGAGLAAACAAGLVVGVTLSPEPTGEDVIASAMTSFDVASAEEI